MKRSRFNEKQILAILTEQDAGMATAEVCRCVGGREYPARRIERSGRGRIAKSAHGEEFGIAQFATHGQEYNLISWREADALNRFTIPDRATIDVGLRYRFAIARSPALLRVKLANVTNVFGWEVQGGGGFATNKPRRLTVAVTADF